MSRPAALRAGARPTAAPEPRRNIVPAWMLQMGFVLAHAPLGLLIQKHSRLGTIHALLALGIGLVFAILPRRSHLVACVGAYVTGGAVFWRMKAAPNLPWEFGKYAIIALFVTAAIFTVRIRRPALPVVYFILLLPAVPLTITAATPEEARKLLSFNLSGPLALAASVIFFSSIQLTTAQMRWVMVSVLAPLVGVATFAAVSLKAALEDPDFAFYGGASNSATSGGFGPNQVSAALGLGIVTILVYLILRPPNRLMTMFMLVLVLFLTRQCLITLSRGGIYMAVGAACAASFFLVRDPAMLKKVVGASAVIGAGLLLVIIPRLQEMTGGILASRFENTSGTGRGQLIKGDMESWSQSPVLGVGPGLGDTNRLKYFTVGTAHTEYTRLVAEHGVFGFVDLIVLAAMTIRALRGQAPLKGRAATAAMLAYALLFMAVDATRLVAPAFAFGLGSVALVLGPRGSRPRPKLAARSPISGRIRKAPH